MLEQPKTAWRGSNFQGFALGLVLCLIAGMCTFLPAHAFAGETGSTDEYAGVGITDSVVLDPFDPVPTVQFDHGCGWRCHRDGYGPGYGQCEHDCRWHGWSCPHDCYGPRLPGPGSYNMGWWRCADDCRGGDWWCDHECRLNGWYCQHECFVRPPCERDCRRLPPMGDPCATICYGRLIHEFEERLERSDGQARRYDAQSRWYFEHVMGDDGPDGPPPAMEPPRGPGRGDYGPPPGDYGPPDGGPPPPMPGPGDHGPPPGDYGPPEGGPPPPMPGPGDNGPPPGPSPEGQSGTYYGTPPGPPPGYGPPPPPAPN